MTMSTAAPAGKGAWLEIIFWISAENFFHPLSDQVNLPFCIANFSIDNKRLFSHESVHKTNAMSKSGGFKHLYGI